MRASQIKSTSPIRVVERDKQVVNTGSKHRLHLGSNSFLQAAIHVTRIIAQPSPECSALNIILSILYPSIHKIQIYHTNLAGGGWKFSPGTSISVCACAPTPSHFRSHRLLVSNRFLFPSQPPYVNGRHLPEAES